MAVAEAFQKNKPTVVVIGAGPAGLMAAETLALAGYAVDIYDGMPSVARKFLLAGKGGMNITHSEPMAAFKTRFYEANDWVSEWIDDFDNNALRAWIHALGVDTFVGTSGRVFPVEMKAAPLLRKWVHRLKEQGVTFHVRHRWHGWNAQGDLCFDHLGNERCVAARAVVLSLGGGSWSTLGSDGAWVNYLPKTVEVAPLKPANCGFYCHWSDFFKDKAKGQPLKGICLSMAGDPVAKNTVKGEAMIDLEGIEGSLVYAHSAAIRKAIERDGVAQVTLDLLPDRSYDALISVLSQPRGKQSLATFLKKRLKLDGIKLALIREQLSSEDMQSSDRLAETIKALPLTLTGTFAIEKAISSAGGVPRDALTPTLMLKQMAGVFCAGEMLDWEAPTGGYLLTASMASGRWAGKGVIEWLA